MRPCVRGCTSFSAAALMGGGHPAQRLLPHNPMFSALSGFGSGTDLGVSRKSVRAQPIVMATRGGPGRLRVDALLGRGWESSLRHPPGRMGWLCINPLGPGVGGRGECPTCTPPHLMGRRAASPTRKYSGACCDWKGSLPSRLPCGIDRARAQRGSPPAAEAGACKNSCSGPSSRICGRAGGGSGPGRGEPAIRKGAKSFVPLPLGSLGLSNDLR